MPPMMIGRGMQAVKVLYVLNGEYGGALGVWNPLTNFPENRTAHAARRRPASCLYVRRGRRRRCIPVAESVEPSREAGDDSGYSRRLYGLIYDFDIFAWTVPGDESTRFKQGGSARVRNVTLPAGMSHVLTPVSADLPDKPAIREWIDAYTPGTTAAVPPGSEVNLLWAADVWWSVKKFWVIEAQRWIRAKRAGGIVNPTPRRAVCRRRETLRTRPCKSVAAPQRNGQEECQSRDLRVGSFRG
jgi:hypothetical protein